jgi:SAM-dependent methyltransferase
MSEAIYSGGYDSFAAEVYDHIVPNRERQDVNFFVESALQVEGPVLEIGCGTGRVLIPTAQAGKDILGLDASQWMLSVCRKKILAEPEAVQNKIVGLHHGDMRHFELDLKFNLVTMPFRPFQYLISAEEQKACLVCIYHHLSSSGRLVFDIMNPSLVHLIDDRYLNEFNEEPETVMADGRRIVRRFRIVARDLANQFIDAEKIYYVTHLDGRVERLVQSFPYRYTFRFEAEHLLGRCGFSIEAIYSDYDKSPFGSKYPSELIIVARKC